MRWDRRYRDLSARLPCLAATARPTLCGLTTCVDAYLPLHRAWPVLAAEPGTPAAALAAQLLRRAAEGIGGEVLVDWPEGPAWIDRHLHSTPGLGGTGAQAAQALALLGAPALLALGDRTPAQLGLLHPDIRLAEGDRIVAAREARPGGVGKPAHYIFEFTAGTPVGPAMPRRSSRTIVRFADEGLDDDPDFWLASVGLALTAGAGILSGFNGLPPDAVDASIRSAAELADAWRAAGLGLIHHELGDYPHAALRDRVVAGLTPHASSFGLSLSELEALSPGAGDPGAKARALGDRFGLNRVCVHADGWALAATRGDPQAELEALMAGCLLAATRAAFGTPTNPDGIPPGAVFPPLPVPVWDRRDGWTMVACAAPYLERPAATIGLGDTFLAGCLLVLGQPPETLSTLTSVEED
ncbi:ADP-dependent glucokinase/phosphofructokinase [Inquilinus limosus]|uniref:ADP-dependent glucokinase/phosphofructokinase n=1 Tax=Inquilinus limosus TaxID=171674 RepID=UPI0006841478|nr:ADP-dependent glucokinase/phosphofructokinase [Inquilinus limosus]